MPSDRSSTRRSASMDASSSGIGVRLTSVNDYRGAGYPRSPRRAEERDNGRDFLRRAEATERNVLLNEAGHSFRVFLLASVPGPATMADRAGRDGIDTDAVRGEG